MKVTHNGVSSRLSSVKCYISVFLCSPVVALQPSLRPFAWGLDLLWMWTFSTTVFLLSLFGSALLSLIRNSQMDVLDSLTLLLSHTCVRHTEACVFSSICAFFFYQTESQQKDGSDRTLARCVSVYAFSSCVSYPGDTCQSA